MSDMWQEYDIFKKNNNQNLIKLICQVVRFFFKCLGTMFFSRGDVATKRHRIAIDFFKHFNIPPITSGQSLPKFSSLH